MTQDILEHTLAHTVVAIDGTVGSGKSTIARLLAQRLGIVHIDTGAMYRTVTLAAHQEGIAITDQTAVARVAARVADQLTLTNDAQQRVLLDGQDVTQAIRTPHVNQDVPTVADNTEVRRILVARQQRMGLEQPVVMEGRDIASVVFPNAPHKFFLDADLETRVDRAIKRYRENGAQPPPRDEVRASVQERDQRDRDRPQGGLVQTRDALLIDTTPMGPEETVDRLAAHVGPVVRP